MLLRDGIYIQNNPTEDPGVKPSDTFLDLVDTRRAIVITTPKHVVTVIAGPSGIEVVEFIEVDICHDYDENGEDEYYKLPVGTIYNWIADTTAQTAGE